MANEKKHSSSKEGHARTSSRSASRNAPKSDGPNAWMVTTIVLAILLLLSLIWNAVLTVMFVTHAASGAVPTAAEAPTPTPTAPSAPTPTQPSQQAPPPKVDVSADDDPVKGDPDAPITIIEFSDYECPFCQRFVQQTMPQLEEEYIKTGKAKLVFRDFPLSFHARAQPAAIAAECVDELADDETYFEMHDLIFENIRALSDDDLRSYATQVGVDAAEFDECYADADGSMAAEVQEDFRAGQAAGARGTPTFFVNGQILVGAQPFSAFQQIIDAELAK